MKLNLKRLITSAMALAVSCSLIVPASADEVVTASEVDIPIEATFATEGFCVTVPTTFAAEFDYLGNATCADNACIVNNSTYAVKITKVGVRGLHVSGTLYNTVHSDISRLEWGTYEDTMSFSWISHDGITEYFAKVGMLLNNCKHTPYTGHTPNLFEFDITGSTLEEEIAAGASLQLTYDFKITPYTICDGPITGAVVFTIVAA